MDMDGFWIFLERSARETTNPRERIQWLEYRLSRISRTHVEDFQVNLNTARHPIDTYAMWGAAYLIMDGLCSGDEFWYFQPWLIGLGRHWHEFAARNPDNLADIPAVRALADRRPGEWTSAERPWWEELAYVANRVHERITGQEDSLYAALAARGQRNPSDPEPTDRAWDFDSLAEIQRRMPRLAGLFPRERYFKA
jgi:uncharacterized protein DUF4240